MRNLRRVTTFALGCVAIAGMTGCASISKGAERVAFVFSLLRSPLVVQTSEVNVCAQSDQLRSLHEISSRMDDDGVYGRDEALADFLWESERRDCDRIFNAANLSDGFDSHQDLVGRDTTVIVALSGGGTRATRAAAHTLGQLEEYIAEQHSPAGALRCAIDAFSTVSGGSIYVSYAAEELTRMIGEDVELCDASRGAPDRFFRDLARRGRFFTGMNNLGGMSSLAYLSPTGLLILPAMTLFTDRSFLDVLAHSLNFTQGKILPFFFRGGPRAERRFGEVPETPRFFVNTVVVETGAPLVLTQRMQHVPSRYAPGWTARLMRGASWEPTTKRPLRHSLTLEDLNSSPARFPLAYAAMASAAMPPVMEPLEIRRFGFDEKDGVYESDETLHLTDGGVFDNSGLTTAVDFFEYLVHRRDELPPERRPTRQRLILLSINAEIARAASVDPREPAEPGSTVGLRPAWPIRIHAFSALDQVHFANKRRSEELAAERLRVLAGRADVDVLFLPVNLSQLSPDDPNHIDGGEPWFERVREIPTDLVISDADDETLEGAIAFILAAEQTTGWDVDGVGTEVHSLRAALGRALSGGSGRNEAGSPPRSAGPEEPPSSP